MIKNIRKIDTNYIIVFIFAIITFFMMINRIPWHDEANAWMIAKSFSFFELFKIERFDGHLFIWHTLLMPFAKANFFYPYSLLLLNWVFCIAAIVVLCFKSPFSYLEKFLITFSFPFVCYFSNVARCYSIGIFLLFIILSLWYKRLEASKQISFLLFLLSNTSVMAAFGGICLYWILLYDLYKSKRNIIFPFCIFIFCIILILIQLYGAVNPIPNEVFQFCIKIKNFLLIDNLLLINLVNAMIVISSIPAIICSIILFVKNRNTQSLFILIVTYSGMILLFSIGYTGQYWHYFFFYIYLIVSVWIFRITNIENINLHKIFFLILLFIFFIKTLIFPIDKYEYINSSQSYEIAKTIKDNELIRKNDKLYAFFTDVDEFCSVIAYLNMPVYDYYGNSRYSVEGYKYNMRLHLKPVDTNSLANSLPRAVAGALG